MKQEQRELLACILKQIDSIYKHREPDQYVLDYQVKFFGGINDIIPIKGLLFNIDIPSNDECNSNIALIQFKTELSKYRYNKIKQFLMANFEEDIKDIKQFEEDKLLISLTLNY